jgi:hypothetical protein
MLRRANLASSEPRVELAAKLHHVDIERKAWTTAAPIRAIFDAAFKAAGLLYCNPHSLRGTLVLLDQRGVSDTRGLHGLEPEPRA